MYYIHYSSYPDKDYRVGSKPGDMTVPHARERARERERVRACVRRGSPTAPLVCAEEKKKDLSSCSSLLMDATVAGFTDNVSRDYLRTCRWIHARTR